ncbi:MAG: hypothetical protein LWW79_05300 [Holophagaceae bacterium]|nr:hypothetical protein [Holophagaceae bacterium]
MRRFALFLFAAALLLGQTARLDDGRLDPSWFGPGVAFQPSKALGFQWLKPNLDLRNRSLRLRAWESVAWVQGPRAGKDQAFLSRVAPGLPADLERGLKKGLKGALPVSTNSGDLVLVARVADALGADDDYMAVRPMTLSFDLKLVDGDSGEVLAAFHDTITGPNTDAISYHFGRWCEAMGRVLAPAAAAPAPAVAQALPAPPKSAFDLEGALRRIDALGRDGLLSEAECEALRKKARDKAQAR